MKKAIVLVSIFFILVLGTGISSVFASPDLQSTSTPTPTRDYRTPPSPAPMATVQVSSLDFSCPIGTPVGYGQVQADQAWLASCAHCLPTPTQYPRWDFAESILDYKISCLGGDLNCVQIDGDSIELLSIGEIYPAGQSSFMLHGDYDLWAFYRFRGYRQYDSILQSDSFYSITLGVDGGTSLYSAFQGDYDLELDYAGTSASEAGIHDIYYRLEEAPGQIRQDLGCSRIILTVGEYNPYVGPGCEEPDICDFEPDPDLMVVFQDIEVFNAGGGSQSNSWTCGDWYNGFYCDVVQSQSGVTQYNNFLTFRFNNVPDPPYDHFYILGTATGYFSYGTPSLSAAGMVCDEVAVGGGSEYWSTGNEPDVGTGVLTGVHCRMNVNYFGLEGVTVFANSGNNTSGTFSYRIIVMPEPVYEFPCGGNVTNPLGDVDVAYCASVVPVQDSVLDYEVFQQTGNSACVNIPYFEGRDFVPDWLESILELLPLWGVILDGFFPASTICLVEYQFLNINFLGVAVPFGWLFSILIVVWVLYRLTRK